MNEHHRNRREFLDHCQELNLASLHLALQPDSDKTEDQVPPIVLGQMLLRLFNQALAYPALLRLAPDRLPALIHHATSAAGPHPEIGSRQVVQVTITTSNPQHPAEILEFISYEARGSLLTNGPVPRTCLDLRVRGERVCSVLLEPKPSATSSELEVLAVSSYHPGVWEQWIQEWDRQT